MSKLQELADQLEKQPQPPVHTWQPEYEGKIDIFIDANGFWFHEGDPILRDTLVRLFASILWREHNAFFLVTPAEKLQIQVADVPFIVHQAENVEGTWVFTTNTHDSVIVSHDHPVELREFQGQALPYVRVRYDLWARVNRSVYFQLISEAMETDASLPLNLSSGNYLFPVAAED